MMIFKYNLKVSLTDVSNSKGVGTVIVLKIFSFHLLPLAC